MKLRIPELIKPPDYLFINHYGFQVSYFIQKIIIGANIVCFDAQIGLDLGGGSCVFWTRPPHPSALSCFPVQDGPDQPVLAVTALDVPWELGLLSVVAARWVLAGWPCCRWHAADALSGESWKTHLPLRSHAAPQVRCLPRPLPSLPTPDSRQLWCSC